MAHTTRQANTALDKAIQHVVARYPDIYIPGIRLILDEIPSEVLHELGDDRCGPAPEEET
jgi:hypothetical protein